MQIVAMCSAGAALLGVLLYTGLLKSARNRVLTEVFEATNDLKIASSELESLRKAGITSPVAPALVRSKLRLAKSASQHAKQALMLDLTNAAAGDVAHRAHQFLRFAVADSEALEARTLSIRLSFVNLLLSIIKAS